MPSGSEPQAERAAKLRAFLEALDPSRPDAQRHYAFDSILQQLPALVAELRREPALPGAPRNYWDSLLRRNRVACSLHRSAGWFDESRVGVLTVWCVLVCSGGWFRRPPWPADSWHGCTRQGCGNRRVLGTTRFLALRIVRAVVEVPIRPTAALPCCSSRFERPIAHSHLPPLPRRPRPGTGSRWIRYWRLCSLRSSSSSSSRTATWCTHLCSRWPMPVRRFAPPRALSQSKALLPPPQRADDGPALWVLKHGMGVCSLRAQPSRCRPWHRSGTR